MVKRKTISKKTRFDVFKRDGFKCAYCGESPPNVTLHVDHIDPLAEGGKSEMSNYITSCADCNLGKGPTPLHKDIPQKLLISLDEMKEKEEQIVEYRKFIKKLNRRKNKDIKDICKIYSTHFEKLELSESFKIASLKKFLLLLPKHEVVESMHLAINKSPVDSGRAIKYFCGVCWRKIKGDLPSQRRGD